MTLLTTEDFNRKAGRACLLAQFFALWCFGPSARYWRQAGTWPGGAYQKNPLRHKAGHICNHASILNTGCPIIVVPRPALTPP